MTFRPVRDGTRFYDSICYPHSIPDGIKTGVDQLAYWKKIEVKTGEKVVSKQNAKLIAHPKNKKKNET